jgi:uncharacterized phage-associated protein
MTYEETLALLLLPYPPHLAEQVTPLPLIKLLYVTHPRALLGFVHLGHKDQDLLRTTVGNRWGLGR